MTSMMIIINKKIFVVKFCDWKFSYWFYNPVGLDPPYRGPSSMACETRAKVIRVIRVIGAIRVIRVIRVIMMQV